MSCTPLAASRNAALKVLLSMLVLTSDVLPKNTRTITFPEWCGEHVLVVLPGSGLDRSTIEALNRDCIIIEWLQPPVSNAAVLNDVAGWLEDRLRRAVGPLLFMSQPHDGATRPADVSPHAVKAQITADGRLSRLVLGEMVATSPLLPPFLRTIVERKVSDTLFVELLAEPFSLDDA